MDFANLPPNHLLAFITADIKTEFGAKLSQDLLAIDGQLQQAGIVVKLLNYGEGVDSEVVINDSQGQVWKQAEDLKKHINPGENLILARLVNNNLEILELKPQLEKDLDWLSALVEVGNNYSDNSEPSDGYFKWGQQVIEDGEYLCKDCGYILDLTAGQIFPICEVCLSGQPDGPAGPSEGYWEKI
jgi:hypothetical protein